MYGNVAVLGISTGLGTSGATLAATGHSTAALLMTASVAVLLGLALMARSTRIRRSKNIIDN